MSTTFESDWENTRLKEQLAAKDDEIERYKQSPTVETCRKMIQRLEQKNDHKTTVLLKARDVLTLPCDRWIKSQTLIINDTIAAIDGALG